jgi:NAD-dependent deacetylase
MSFMLFESDRNRKQFSCSVFSAGKINGMTSLPDAHRLVAQASRIAVLTGAGISTDSGIPDFRGPQGLWTLNPKAERTSTLHHYLNDPEVREIAWQNRLHSPAWSAQPNAGHDSLVELERQGRLHVLVTQNIDELHQRAGTSPQLVVEIHGTMRRAVCWSCDQRWPMEVFVERVRQGETDPGCPDCAGVVKSATISFGQNLVAEDLERAFSAAAECDLLLAIGTTLAVGPINKMVPIAVAAGNPVVIVNGSATEMDSRASAVVNGSITEILPALLVSPPILVAFGRRSSIGIPDQLCRV